MKHNEKTSPAKAKDYIDRQTFLDILDAKAEMAMGTPKQVFNSVYKMLELLPAADVVEVVHGKWENFTRIKLKQIDGKIPVMLPEYYAQCSSCAHCFIMAAKDHFNFCPHCGAKMDGERKDDR